MKHEAPFQPQQNSVRRGNLVLCRLEIFGGESSTTPFFFFVLYILVICVGLSKGSVQFRQIILAETRHGLTFLWLKFLLGHSFPHPSRPALGLTHSLVQLILDIFPEGKVAEAWHCPSTLT